MRQHTAKIFHLLMAVALGLSACAATTAREASPPASSPSSASSASSADAAPNRLARAAPQPAVDAADQTIADSSAQGPSAAPDRTDASIELFDLWLQDFRGRAIAQGIHGEVYDTAVAGITPNMKVIEATKQQPEFVRPIWEYIEKAVSDYRIKKGRELLVEHKALFDEIEQEYGVQREYLVAIWGMESAFGSFMGDTYVIEALATLGYRGARTDYGREQLIGALTILQNGYATRDLLKGSWAGAMGQTQFIPTTYLGFAVDHDKDGKRDIWTDLEDVFASTSNYLAKSGWRPGQQFGQEIVLADSFDYSLAEPTIVKTVADWQELGVQPVPGRSLDPVRNEVGSVILPAGHRGPAFLVFNNFRAIMRYNNATSYALGVGILAERIAGGPAIAGAWPRHEQPLSRTDRKQVQTLLSDLGYSTGGVDGIIGAQTRSAVRLYQRDKGLPADGFVTKGLLALLMDDSRSR